MGNEEALRLGPLSSICVDKGPNIHTKNKIILNLFYFLNGFLD